MQVVLGHLMDPCQPSVPARHGGHLVQEQESLITEMPQHSVQHVFLPSETGVLHVDVRYLIASSVQFLHQQHQQAGLPASSDPAKHGHFGTGGGNDLRKGDVPLEQPFLPGI